MDLQEANTLGNRWYLKCMEKARSKYAFWWLNAISFAESSVLPFPPDWLMIPMILSDRSQAWHLAFWATVSSVLGGIFGYAIGAFLYQTVGVWVIDFYSLNASMDRFQEGFNNWGFWIIVVKGLTPIPYKLVTIASGMAGYSFHWFILASIIARAFRFYLLTALLWHFGPLAQDLMSRYFMWLFALSLVLIVVGTYVVMFFF